MICIILWCDLLLSHHSLLNVFYFVLITFYPLSLVVILRLMVMRFHN